MPRIQVLPPGLVNQIAAGEVVERPSSVVKELVENSLDAGALSIQVEVEDGGLSLVRVADDGSGMEREDALLAMERHATSKLRDTAGLGAIATMGFRGEALPAIASVARLRLDTCPGADGAGTRIEVEGGRVLGVTGVARARGTTVEVRDLFFNTPARRKFVRAPATEAGHAAEAALRPALARCDVAFLLRSGPRVAWSFAAGSPLGERAAAALGREACAHLLPVDGSRGEVRVRGVVSGPDHSQATSRSLYLYVNGRYVRDRGAAHAVLRAFAGSLPAGRHPAGILFVELPLGRVDVNAHPQKLEVRFADARAVYDAVHAAVAEALRPSPWLRHPAGPVPAPVDATAEGLPAVPLAAEAAAVLAEARHAGRGEGLPFPHPAAAEGLGPVLGGYFASLRLVGQHARTYLVCEAPGGALVVVDQHASHERLLFHRLREALRARALAVQPFLIPPVVTVPAAAARILEGARAELGRLGLELEPFGGDSLAVKSAPALLGGVPLGPLLSDLAQQLAHLETGSALDEALDDLLATMACHAAIRAGEAVGPEEARKLLDGLDAVDFKARCPHGRPVVFELPLADLETRVGRR
ncbi:MAG TPA: DNA mismatch repair endonuclease MutL [Anaeromyxobacteraceae bacterium]|nr:DNA mismatch repair endonuclease MutL [Anaeromyxobacteraceae bacterium]